MSSPAQRSHVEALLRHPLAPLRGDLRKAYDAYQLKHYWRFLLLVNILAHLAFLSYGFADALVLPDLRWRSLIARAAFLSLLFPAVMLIFWRCRNAQLLDLVLPSCIVFSAMFWFGLLATTEYPTGNYLYASLVFIVLANLCVQVRFLPSLVTSLLITLVVLVGGAWLNRGVEGAMKIFILVYFPVLFFSLFISWSTTLDRRRTFLRSVLDDMNRDALSQANERLQELAHTDALTGLHNRRHFEESARQEISRARRHRQPLCMLAMDVDHFKLINDGHGHDVGDRVLQVLSVTARSQLREIDELARFGGEEFVVLLPNTPREQAQQVAERLRLAMAERVVEAGNGQTLRCTVSIGIVQLNDDTPDLHALLKAADRALYQAKESGRNRTCVA
ncbi:GGDEF domain-containing protein [Stutzerimonas tarimensis]|uniref:diguanylate cyclase n=1 Tax=Stutzerimonas tarimensis TaxID=1507735 RepID=A0ABV7T8I7_9GAMM